MQSAGITTFVTQTHTSLLVSPGGPAAWIQITNFGPGMLRLNEREVYDLLAGQSTLFYKGNDVVISAQAIDTPLCCSVSFLP